MKSKTNFFATDKINKFIVALLLYIYFFSMAIVPIKIFANDLEINCQIAVSCLWQLLLDVDFSLVQDHRMIIYCLLWNVDIASLEIDAVDHVSVTLID